LRQAGAAVDFFLLTTAASVRLGHVTFVPLRRALRLARLRALSILRSVALLSLRLCLAGLERRRDRIGVRWRREQWIAARR